MNRVGFLFSEEGVRQVFPPFSYSLGRSSSFPISYKKKVQIDQQNSSVQVKSAILNGE